MRFASRRGLVFGALGLLLAVRAPASELVAIQLDASNTAELAIGGPDAIGGSGDWYLANDRIALVVDDPARRHAKLNHGGTLIDLGLRGRGGDDQFAQIFPLANLDQRVQLAYDRIRAEVDPAGRWARLVVEASQGMSSIPRGGWLARHFDPLVPESEDLAVVAVETEYRVEPGQPWVSIRTTFHNRGAEPAPFFAYGDVWMRGGHSLRAFVGNTLEPALGSGFHHRDFDRHDILASAEANAPSSFVAMAGLPDYPPIVYALLSPERAARGLRNFGVTGEHVSLVNGFVGDPDWRSLDLLRFLRATRTRLAPGASWSFERRVLAVEGDDIAAATDLVFPLLGFADGTSGLRGRVEAAAERRSIQIDDAEGHPITQVLVAPGETQWSAVLPPGRYRCTLRSAQHAPQTFAAEVVAGAYAAAPAIALPPRGELRFEPAFADAGAGRVILAGLGDTPDPVFGAELLDFRIDGEPAPSGSETHEIHFVGNSHDPTNVALAPGRYELIATRGPWHEIERREVVVEAGRTTHVEPFALHRAIALPGVWSGDFHVHAQASDDSGISNEQRLRGYVAEDVDVMISTDHDHVADFAPALAALELGDRIRVIHGVEVTSSTPSHAAPYTLGHHNAWPITRQPLAHRRGAPPSQELALADLQALLRREYGAEVVQLNHALRGDGGREDGAYLTHLGDRGQAFDPSRRLDQEPNRALLARSADGSAQALDFDAMELMNGRSFAQYLRLREVWYALLRQGVRRTATGNSDTHGSDEIPAYPRNQVWLDAEAPDEAAFHGAVRAGRVVATNGPTIARFTVNGAQMGELAAAPSGRVEIRYAVMAPSWIPVDEVRLLVDGVVRRLHRDELRTGVTLRLEASEELELEADAFVTLEAGAALDSAPRRWRRERGGLYASRVAPGFVAQALANPIFVDVDGNGRFDSPQPAPPGVQGRLPTR